MREQQRAQRERERRGPAGPWPQQQAVMMLEGLEARRLFSGSSGDVVFHWNEVMLQSLTSQPPLLRAPRNEALVHVAMFDAVNAIDRSYEPYAVNVRASRGASQDAAAAQAAHDTLAALYPSRQAVFDAALAEDLAKIPAGTARQGVAVGREVARQILELRANDGSGTAVGYTPPNSEPGQWQPTLPDLSPAAGAYFTQMTPFAVQSHSQFQPGPPPALNSPEYAAGFNETKAFGRADSAVRTADQTLVARLWQSPLPYFQIWNRVAQDVAQARELSLPQSARLFAMMDVALSDALGTSFASKYAYALWRPITAIHRAGEDGNAATEADPTWAPLHVNTPPYPTYAGNAATIGAACATVLAHAFGTDAVEFDVDWGRYGFAGVTRSYSSFSAAAGEAADSRIYGGIHFRFDSVAGRQIGTDVAAYVIENVLQPRANGNPHVASLAGAAASPFADDPGAVVSGSMQALVLFEAEPNDVIGNN